MENRAHALVAILFLALLAGGGTYLFFWMKGPEVEDRIYRAVTRHSVGSLRAESEVTYKGLVVGHVKAVRFHPEEPDKVIIRLGIRAGVPVTESTYAQIGSRGLTGGTYLALKKDPAGSDRPLATSSESPARLDLREGPFTGLMGNAREIAEQVNTLSQQLNQLTGKENRKRVAALLSRAVTVLDRLDALTTTLQPSAERLDALLAETEQTVGEGREAFSRIRELASGAREEVARVGEAARSLRRLGDSGQEALQAGRHRLLPRLDTLAERFDRIARNLEQLSAILREQPQAVLYGTPPQTPGPGEQGFQWPAPREDGR